MSTAKWRAIQRQRDAFLKTTVARFKKALNAAAEPSIKAYESGSGTWNIDQDEIRKAYIQTYQLVGVYFAKRELRELEKRFGLKRQKDNADDLTPTWLQFMQNFAINQAGERIVSVTNTTLTQIRKVINESVTEGFGSAETGRMIRRKWREITRWRSEMIARTEIVSASNRGTLLGAQATGLELKKNWLATPGARTRDDHAFANGQQVGINEEFNVGGENMECPGDPDASAANTINCRCSISFEPS